MAAIPSEFIHQPRDHGIERDVTRRRQEVRLVHHHHGEVALEEMARPAEPRVDRPGVAPAAPRDAA